MRVTRKTGLLLLCALLVACGKGKEKNIDPPAELVAFSPRVDVARVWSGGGGGGDEVLRLGLRPAVADGVAYVAGYGGAIEALDLATGRARWRFSSKLPFGGGPGVGEGLVAAGSVAGDVVALEAASGAQRWRVTVGGEVLSAPAIGGGLVVVRTVDGRIRGLRASDGSEAWNYEQPVPRLTLRGNGGPVIHGDVVLAGFDNGRVVALALASGDLLWTATVAPAKGRTEIERLVDIDSTVAIVGEDVFVVGFQGRVAMLALESGQIWWARELSSHRGLAADEDKLYVTLADSTVVALRRRDGTEVWRQAQFLHRALSAPAVQGELLAVGDFEGQLHWLDTATGAVVGRAKAGGGRISNRPVAAGDLWLVQADSGTAHALRTRPRASG